MTLECLTSSIMKKSVSVTLLAIILLQSCVVYQKTPVSLEKAYERGNAKVILANNKTMEVKNIVKGDTLWYSHNIGNTYIKVPVKASDVISVYLKDDKKTKNTRIWVVAGLVAGLGLVVLIAMMVGTKF